MLKIQGSFYFGPILGGYLPMQNLWSYWGMFLIVLFGLVMQCPMKNGLIQWYRSLRFAWSFGLSYDTLMEERCGHAMSPLAKTGYICPCCFWPTVYSDMMFYDFVTYIIYIYIYRETICLRIMLRNAMNSVSKSSRILAANFRDVWVSMVWARPIFRRVGNLLLTIW